MASLRARSRRKQCTSAIELGVVFGVSIEEQRADHKAARAWPVRLLLQRRGGIKLPDDVAFALRLPPPSHDTLITHGFYLWIRALLGSSRFSSLLALHSLRIILCPTSPVCSAVHRHHLIDCHKILTAQSVYSTSLLIAPSSRQAFFTTARSKPGVAAAEAFGSGSYGR